MSDTRIAADSLDVSVVIPALDRASTIERAVASAFAQVPLGAAEVLVIDDGSTDATAERARAAGALVISHATNRGVGAARNTGVEAAASPWVALLDSDDEWLPWHLEVLTSLRTPEAVVVADSAVVVGRESRWNGAGARGVTTIDSPRRLLFPENFVATSATMLRRETFLGVGRYTEGMTQAEDLDLLVRMLERGSARIAARAGVVYHQHDGQASLDLERMRDSHRGVITRYADRGWYDPGMLEDWNTACAWDDLRSALGRREFGVASRVGLELARHPRRLSAIGRVERWRRQGRHRLREARRLGDVPC